MSVISEGALSIRLHFTGVSLPAGARLFVYSMKKPDEIYGPYENRGPSSDGTFWTPPITGDGAVIEYFTSNSTSDPGDAGFRVSEVSHIFADPLTNSTSAGPKAAALECDNVVPLGWADAASSVGHLQFTRPDGEFICTGTLLNDRASDFIPYFLTANHCFNTQASAQSLRVYWFYEAGDSPPFLTPYTDGSILLATGTESDFTFVKLIGPVAFGVAYAGWTTTDPTVNSSVATIHHPEGSSKRISYGTAASLTCPSNLPGACENFTRVNWYSGFTKPGSSGAPLFTGSPANARYIGTLWGGDDSQTCAIPGADYYSKFSVTYQRIASFLEGTPQPTATRNLLWQNQANGSIGKWLMNGASLSQILNFSPGQVSDTNWKIVSTSDFNRDGQPDLVWQHQTNGLIGVWLMSGVEQAQSLLFNPSQVGDTNWKIVGTADFNSDGKPDLVWQHRANGLIGVWLMDGTSLSQSVYFNPAQVSDTNWRIAGIGDFNADGRPDLVWQNGANGSIGVWLMNGINRIDVRMFNPDRVGDTNWRIVGVADFNGDSGPDLVWQHGTNGQIGVWLMSGVNQTQSLLFNPNQVGDTNWKIVGIQ